MAHRVQGCKTTVKYDPTTKKYTTQEGGAATTVNVGGVDWKNVVLGITGTGVTWSTENSGKYTHKGYVESLTKGNLS